jgi:hypothetical protein
MKIDKMMITVYWSDSTKTLEELTVSIFELEEVMKPANSTETMMQSCPV